MVTKKVCKKQHFIQARQISGFADESQKSVPNKRKRVVGACIKDKNTVRELKVSSESIGFQNEIYGPAGEGSLDAFITERECEFNKLSALLEKMRSGVLDCDHESFCNMRLFLAFSSARTKDSIAFGLNSGTSLKGAVSKITADKSFFIQQYGSAYDLLSKLPCSILIDLNEGIGVLPGFVVSAGTKERALPFYMAYGKKGLNLLGEGPSWAFMPLNSKKGLLLAKTEQEVKYFKKQYLVVTVGYSDKLIFPPKEVHPEVHACIKTRIGTLKIAFEANSGLGLL